MLANASNHQSIKITNRALVLKMVCTGENISRIDISRQTGLSKMSVTNIVNSLIDEGYIVEAGKNPDAMQDGQSGRKPVGLAADTMTHAVLGLYISRDFVHASLSNILCESIYEHKYMLSKEETGDSFLEKILFAVSTVLHSDEALKRNILGIGVSCIGPLDQKNGIILDPPNFHNIHAISIADIFKSRFGLNGWINNDMNASAIAEMHFGNARNRSSFIYAGVTNGIGAGIVTGNALFEGDMGFSGEIGHTTIDYNGSQCDCGNVGCLELYASIPQMEKHAVDIASKYPEGMLGKELQTNGRIVWHTIVEYAKMQDPAALMVMEKLCTYLSAGLVSIVNMYDPAVIILGHDIALAGQIIASLLEEKINSRIFSRKYKKVEVLISAFLDKAPVAGVSALLLEKLFNGHEFGRKERQ